MASKHTTKTEQSPKRVKSAPEQATAAPASDLPTAKPKFSWARWCDEWKMALAGVLLAFKKPRFIITVVLTVLIFGTLMNLLTNGLSQFMLLFKLDWGGKWAVFSSAFLAVFGVGRAFVDWLSVFGVALLQGILLGLVVIVWRHNKRQAAAANTANAQTASIAAGLAVLSAGCPTCGTSLLLPIIGTFTSAGGALAGTISGIVYAIAILVALWALKRVGREAYAIIITEKRGKHE